MTNDICNDCVQREEFYERMDRVRGALDIVMEDMDLLFLEELIPLTERASGCMYDAYSTREFDKELEDNAALNANS
ncbi:hypothetical protein MRI28_11020 [Nocardiopsis dassonvillei]|uniref:hypothetical protein n=1 Tax=Nocardiopsis dassonvillei TaxID=2014 RepID=UPI00200BBA6F|nr:hypothetical protein [Nocardiopsis dassonvillei]MCK9870164.1 hypothetical protein [Nocardiopsis dassonvillei]